MVTTPSRSGQGGKVTAKERIRDAALDLYSDFGEDGTSMRAIAHAAGVTVGLVVHHFQTKDGLRDAVERYIVDLFADTIHRVPVTSVPGELAAGQNQAIARMLAERRDVLGYLRRAVLDSTGNRGSVLKMLTDLAVENVTALREGGFASTENRLSDQVIGVMVRQLGQQFLQPMVDMMWVQLSGADAQERDKPRLVVHIEDPAEPGGR